MKQYINKTFLGLLLVGILLQACKLDTPNSNVEINYVYGNLKKSGSILSVTRDDSTTVMLKNIGIPDSMLNKRLYVEGNFYKNNNGFDYTMEVYMCLLPFIKEFQFLENLSSFNEKDKESTFFSTNGMVQTGKYLNFSLGYYYLEPNERHSFKFVVDEETETFENDKVKVNIFHNSDNINKLQQKQYCVFSLDLTSLFEKFAKDFDIHFVFYENSNQKEFILNIKNLKEQP
jgi:hypothetical protein